MPHRYLEIDVFTTRPLYGNALAVVADADDLADERMQRIAAWTNCSETIFLLRPSLPGADYRVRIFTGRQELPFAGHPSVGAAYAARHLGLVDRSKGELHQQCAAGLLPVRVDDPGGDGGLHVRTPTASGSEVAAKDSHRLEAALGATARGTPWHVCNGPRWMVAELDDIHTLRQLLPDMAQLEALTKRLGAIGVCVFAAAGGRDHAMAVRAFCPGDAILEDPVTGSANAAIAAYLVGTGQLQRYGSRYSASQGRELGRDGRVEVRVSDDGAIWIGGRCVLVVDGALLNTVA
jgi:PhzF family phenazine biosynthesis protein